MLDDNVAYRSRLLTTTNEWLLPPAVDPTIIA
jgi:hypothetical protein